MSKSAGFDGGPSPALPLAGRTRPGNPHPHGRSEVAPTGFAGFLRRATFELGPTPVRVGRDPDNHIVCDDHGVSGRHCELIREPSGAVVVVDLGSTNGTWIAGARLEAPTRLEPGVTLTIGGYLIRLIEPTPAVALLPGPRPLLGVFGPLIRRSGDAKLQRFVDRISRYAREWDAAGRPTRLLLRGRSLARARELIARRQPDSDADVDFGELEHSFVFASVSGRERGRALRLAGLISGGLALLGGLALVLTLDCDADEVAAAEPEPEPDTGHELVPRGDEIDAEADRRPRSRVEHVVVPAETLEEIAIRYDVPLPMLMRHNGIDETAKLRAGQILSVHAARHPLAQQQIVYRTEDHESWSSLAQRFDVPVAKLRAQNPEAGDALPPNTELSIWIEPKPLRRKTRVEIPEFEVRPDALSVGAPRNGKLIKGIEFPRNDALYKRRYPNIMWSSSHTAKHLREAVAAFRYTYEFEGELVVADISKRNGGSYGRHKSHQSGRDVDFWLPTLKGVYKRDHLTLRDYRPQPEEADWFALYAFLRALHETGAVEVVFLDYSLHDRVYKAAKLMGASDEELVEMIAYPRGPGARALLRHSDAHTHHIHIRFKCGPMDIDCTNYADPTPGD